MHHLKIINNKNFLFFNTLKMVKRKLKAELQLTLLKIGNLLKLESPSEYVICEITYLNFYFNFEEMLTKEGLKNMLPFIDSLKKGIKVYQNFSGANRIKNLDVVQLV